MSEPEAGNVCLILDLGARASDLMALARAGTPLPAAGGPGQARPTAISTLESDAHGLPLAQRLADCLQRLSGRWKRAVVAPEEMGRAGKVLQAFPVLTIAGQLRERIAAACRQLQADTAIVFGFDSPLVTCRACEELLVEHQSCSVGLTLPTCYPLGAAPIIVQAQALRASGPLQPHNASSFAADRSRLFGSRLKATYDSPLGRELLRAPSTFAPTPTRIARFVIDNPRRFLEAVLEQMPAGALAQLEEARSHRTGRNLAIVGYFGRGNLGDEMILEAMIQAMRSRGLNGNVVVISGDPEDTRSRHGVQAVSSSDCLQVLKAVAASDALVIGGGGLLHDSGGLDVGDALDRFLEGSPGLVQLLALAMLARALGTPVKIVGVGIGPLFRELAIDLVHQLLRTSEAASLRDAGSLEWCELWEDLTGKARLSADLSFLLEARRRSGGAEPQRPTVALAPRRWFQSAGPLSPGGASRGQWLDLADMWAETCDLIADETGADILLVPFQRAEGNLDDLALCQEIASKMQRSDRAHVLAPPRSCAELFEQLSRAHVVIAVRMHAVAAAALCGIPCVAVSYDPKVGGLMTELGIEEFVIAPHEASAPGVAALVGRALEERMTIAARLAGAREELRKRAAASIDLLNSAPEASASRPQPPPEAE
jgi:polysaccharide pyruvyl transferase CsaB